MTPEQFVIWLKGFVTASNNYNLTPKAWDEVKETLDKVEVKEQIKINIWKNK